MQYRSANSAEEPSRSGTEKERRRKDAPCAAPGVNRCGGGQLCDEQNENLTAAYLTAKDRFKILVSETEYSKSSDPKKHDDSEHPIYRGADDRFQIGWNLFDFFDSVPPDQRALLKRDPG